MRYIKEIRVRIGDLYTDCNTFKTVPKWLDKATSFPKYILTDTPDDRAMGVMFDWFQATKFEEKAHIYGMTFKRTMAQSINHDTMKSYAVHIVEEEDCNDM